MQLASSAIAAPKKNVGGRNGCGAAGTLGSYCGDGILQPDSEEYDEADPNAPSNCAGCRLIVVK